MDEWFLSGIPPFNFGISRKIRKTSSAKPCVEDHTLDEKVFESGCLPMYSQAVEPHENVQEEAQKRAAASVDGGDEHGAPRQPTLEDGPAAHRLGGKGLGSADR